MERNCPAGRDALLRVRNGLEMPGFGQCGIGGVCVELVEARRGHFDSWFQSKGRLGGQHKVPRLSNTREYIDELLKFND